LFIILSKAYPASIRQLNSMDTNPRKMLEFEIEQIESQDIDYNI
jgi:hypothetical protein